jgi:cobaltochelatase CobN
VNGFEILPLAALGRPRVDVTLRISGLFRDVFPTQIALFAAAVRAVADLDESEDDNLLAAFKGASLDRIFGAAPGAYGVGLGRRIAEGDWRDRDELAGIYLDATSHAYRGEGEARRAPEAFRECVAAADLFLHAQDLPGQDALDADAFAEHEGGFAAAAASLGAKPALYHLDSTTPGAPKVRTLAQEIARALRARATNPRWLAGQMRHGHRGAAEIAQSLDNLYAFATLTDAVESAQFDLMFDATLGDERVRAFLEESNPLAARHMAAVFAEAERRCFWLSRRNSSAAILASLMEAA